MNVYRVIRDEGFSSIDVREGTYARTFNDAKMLAKNVAIALNPTEYIVQLVKIKTDSASIVMYLNGAIPEGEVLREWEITKRRGLKALKDEEV